MNVLANILLILIAVLLFAFIIFFHEFGHFFTAKLCKIKVNEFAIGMGPKIVSWVKGDTRYSLRLLPIGGYCAMEGEDEDSDDEHAFGSRPVWQRMLVIVAGGVMNIILGILMMGILLSTQGQYPTTEISKFEPNSAFEAAGFEVGDKFLSVDDYKIHSSRDLSFGIAMADPNDVNFVVARDGREVAIDHVKLKTSEGENGATVVSYDFYVRPGIPSVGDTIKRSFTETYSLVRVVLMSLKGIVTGQFGLNDLAGPLGAAQMIAQAAQSGLADRGFGMAVSNIWLIMILITVNLGIVNLLPIPALDGGRLLFLLFELIFRKPVPVKYEGWIHTAGFVLLMVLMVVVAFNDIVRIVTGGTNG